MEIIENIKNEINNSINNFNLSELYFVKDLLINHKYNIFITGIGKCDIIAHYFIDLLKSISYKAFHISIQNSTHGDIGCIDEKDLIILFSKSGNTSEIINFLNIQKIQNVKTLSITCNQEGKINKLTKYNITLPFHDEINIGIKNIPNNSSLLMVIFINIIIKMIENIDIYEYKLNHSGGNIGDDLKTIDNLMIKKYPTLILKNNNFLRITDIVLEMTNKKIGIAIINDENNNIIGIISDGDIRRLLLKNKDLNNLTKEDINQDFYKFNDTSIFFKDIKGLLLKYKFIPVIKDKKCIGLLIENLIKNNFK